MSMPQPIHVALIGSSAEVVRRAAKHFRLSAPGIGAAYLVSLDDASVGPIHRLNDVPIGLIQLWVALDVIALDASQIRYRSDAQQPRYGRGFYNESLPEPCVLIDFDRSPTIAKKELTGLAEKIISAWYDSS